MSVNLVSSIIRCVLNAREFPRDYLTMSRRSDIMCEPINHPELIRLILLAALTENLSTRRNSKVFGENGVEERVSVYAGRHPAPAPRSRTRTSTNPSRDPGDNSPPPTLVHRLISQDTPSRSLSSLSLSLSLSLSRSFARTSIPF